MMRRPSIIALAVVAVVTSVSASAQGSLGTQGFGYPPGQFSTRSLATGGALSEFDLDSPINPASTGLAGEPRLFLQYEPEFRRLTNGATSSNTTTSRFPVIAVLIPAGTHTTLGVSVSTFLDRSSATKITRTLDVAGTLANITETNRVVGSINDVRLSAGYAPNQKVQVGLGGHVFTGQNRDQFSQTFPDTLKFSAINQVTSLSFTGFGVSAGVLLRPSRILSIGISGLKGAKISTHVGDTTVTEANIPDRISAGFSYEGIPGSSISARVSRELWSKLNGLSGPTGSAAVDGWDSGLGLEAAGPRISERQTIFRLGARFRTLPFEAAKEKVKELSFSGGLGAQFFRNRAAFDFGAEYATRKSNAASLSDIKERAFIFSFGLRVRP
ncbi:MAG: hypothetical protein ABIQ55_05375 [Gemmatimonadaceae bacterium]